MNNQKTGIKYITITPGKTAEDALKDPFCVAHDKWNGLPSVVIEYKILEVKS